MINAFVVGDAEVSAKLDRIVGDMPKAVTEGIGRLVLKLQTKVKTEKLSGQVLNVRTGRLRRSIEQVVQTEGDLVSGIVSTNVKYAAFHEFGFDGTETVAAHLRRSRERFALPNGGIKKGKLGSGQDANVGEFTRKVNYPAHSFLRTALREMVENGDVSAELRDAVRKVTA